ncbi:MAG TPA: acyloxyacyl hydrolase [Thiobacillaceae bacterium]|nr:acyloxyacyl hydrolase [Thiobacillaceae bacterium]HNU65370.1 acyloxyacyl hydrolase [Thiobacillaceae bacterium]
MIRTTLLALPAALFLAASTVQAADGYGIELGHGDDSTELLRLHARWDWDKRWFEAGNWHLTGYWEAGLGHMWGEGAGARDLWDLGITPVFRLQPNDGRNGLYLEGAVGLHFLSHTRVNRKRQLGSSFNFGDHLGFGLTFGDRGQYDLGYRLQHLSNGGLKKPNDGINFHEIRLTYRY